MKRRTCKECGKSKMHLQTISPKGNYIYRDAKGKCWNGHTCPSCLKAIRKNETLPSITKRLCRLCNKPLRADRYFNHAECVSEIEYSNEFAEFIYDTVGVPVYSDRKRSA